MTYFVADNTYIRWYVEHLHNFPEDFLKEIGMDKKEFEKKFQYIR